MSDTEVLRHFAVHIDETDRHGFIEAPGTAESVAEPLRRIDGTPIGLSALTSLAADFTERRSVWDRDRAQSDRWLAPRLHSALPITRATASDREMWHWLAVTCWSDYVAWRWGERNLVVEDRWVGSINKQALARLWWGSELFRDGGDYSPVEKAFRNQDLINSYVHRTLVRCRSFALGIVEVLSDESGEKLSSKKINDLARVLNLCTAGTPPEARVDFQIDDLAASLTWAGSDAHVPVDWSLPPIGPLAVDTTDQSVFKGKELAQHGMDLARNDN